VEIGTEAAQFPEKKYINGIFLAVWTSTLKSLPLWNEPKYMQIWQYADLKKKKTLIFVHLLYVIVLYNREVRSEISGFASSFNWKLTDNINNSTFPTQLAGQAGQQLIHILSFF
jgi:hypothetical protein